MRSSVERAAPSSVGSSAGMAWTRRAICASIALSASLNDSSTTGGICVFEQLVERRFVLRLQRFEWQALFVRKRNAAASRIVAVARG